MHAGWRTYLVGSAVNCEDKDEDDDEKNRSMSAMLLRQNAADSWEWRNILVTEESRAHATDYNVNRHSQWNEETCLERIMSAYPRAKVRRTDR